MPDDPAARAEAFEPSRREPAPHGGGSTSSAGASGRSASARSSPDRCPARSALARRMRSPADLLAIDPLRTLHRSAAAHFDDPRLVQWAGRYATYSGSSPFRAPATLACIQHLESRYGCWYPRGGLDEVRAALQRVAESVGVEVRTGEEVVADRHGRRRRRRRGAGRRVDGGDLARRRQRRRRARLRRPAARSRGDAGACGGQAARRAGWSCSSPRPATTPGIGHHNVWFSRRRPRPSSPPSTPAGWPATRRSTPASRRSPTRRRHRRVTRTGSCSSTHRRGSPLDRRRGARSPARRARRPRRRPPRAGAVDGRDHAARHGRPVPGSRPGRSTGRRRTAGGRRSCGRATAAPGAACTSSVARAIPAAACRSSLTSARIVADLVT